MNNINPLLLLDYYKTTHSSQYPEGTTKIVSYFTPRMSRLKGEDKLVMFGLQSFIKEYLINAFNENFFNQPKDKVVSQYKRIMENTLGKDVVDCEKIGRLHDLGYLPIEIKALAEGARVPVKVPMFEISNTHPDFAWLVNTLETALSCSLWHPMISANVGYRYRQIVDKYYGISVDDNVPCSRAVGDFSMRGQESIESATRSSAGFALSFLNTATVPMILYFEEYYNCDCEKEPVAFGLTSTEHSVMCSNYAIDGDEITMVKRLLTEKYPNDSFNMVSDSYDYWNLVNNILPLCKNEILNHKGFIGIRGDSGDPVEIATQTVFILWDMFGGTINSKGYKVLDSHLKVVYGDSITPQRLESIYKILIKNGFACNNASLASGSFSMQCMEEDEVFAGQVPMKKLNPFTRDTFGIAIKATYCEVDGRGIQIFKDPKTDDGHFKKSQKGCCIVDYDSNGELRCIDGLRFEDTERNPQNELKTVFKNSEMFKEFTLKEIRDRLHNGGF